MVYEAQDLRLCQLTVSEAGAHSIRSDSPLEALQSLEVQLRLIEVQNHK